LMPIRQMVTSGHLLVFTSWLVTGNMLSGIAHWRHLL
jgi:hypothetical protein